MLLIMMNIVHLYSRVTCSSLEKNAFIFPASSRRSASLVAALFSRGPLAPVSSSSDDMTTMVTWLIAAPEGPGQASRSALAASQTATWNSGQGGSKWAWAGSDQKVSNL